MVKIWINEDICKGCGMCADVCPNNVVEKQENFEPTKVVNSDDCIECLSCLEICPAYAIEHEGLQPVKRLQIETPLLEMIKKIL
ncbi:MAG TPA: 4Fe-4S dicluster domain-containing protein [Candidatus Altiarchaeales archaeon]|nr:4Fe-4S dicluster domain-containing protein [Candidatus Altiarchaeales archaeon]